MGRFILLCLITAACGGERSDVAPAAPPPAPEPVAATADAGPRIAVRGELDPVPGDAAGPDAGAAVAADCGKRAHPITDRPLKEFLLGSPRGRDVKVRVQCPPDDNCAITVALAGEAVVVETVNDGDRIDDTSVSRGDFDHDGREDLAVRVHIEQDYGPDDSGMEITYDELAIFRLDPPEPIWQIETANEPPESAGWFCTGVITVSDADCDGIRERIDETRTCTLGYCEDGNPTDPWGGDDCKRSPEVTQRLYRRAADGTFAEVKAP